MPKALVARQSAFTYFNELLILVNSVFRLVSRPLTTAMIASEMLQSGRIRWRWRPLAFQCALGWSNYVGLAGVLSTVVMGIT
jgi:hypothetical protein